jgi:hypothetical protein
MGTEYNEKVILHEIGDVWRDGRAWKVKLPGGIHTTTTKRHATEFAAALVIQDAADTDPGEQHEPPLTWRVEVRVMGEHAWHRPTGQVFNTEAEAEAERVRISRAWTAVTESRVRPAGYQEE